MNIILPRRNKALHFPLHLFSSNNNLIYIISNVYLCFLFLISNLKYKYMYLVIFMFNNV